MIGIVGLTGGVIASVIVNSLAKRREQKMWDAVNENRRRINRIQTVTKWKKYGKAFSQERAEA